MGPESRKEQIRRLGESKKAQAVGALIEQLGDPNCGYAAERRPGADRPRLEEVRGGNKSCTCADWNVWGTGIGGPSKSVAAAYRAKYDFALDPALGPIYRVRPLVAFGFIESPGEFTRTATRWTFR